MPQRQLPRLQSAFSSGNSLCRPWKKQRRCFRLDHGEDRGKATIMTVTMMTVAMRMSMSTLMYFVKIHSKLKKTWMGEHMHHHRGQWRSLASPPATAATSPTAASAAKTSKTTTSATTTATSTTSTTTPAFEILKLCLLQSFPCLYLRHFRSMMIQYYKTCPHLQRPQWREAG